jgi:hypothetical protein
MRFQDSTTVNISFVIFVIMSCGWTGSYYHLLLSSNNKPLIEHIERSLDKVKYMFLGRQKSVNDKCIS